MKYPPPANPDYAGEQGKHELPGTGARAAR